jgi:hypothetical protein
MTRSGRIISVGASALAVLALGFVVSIAATSVPGRGSEEPFIDVAWRPGIDVITVLTWLMIITAVIGALILVLSAREPRPPSEHKRRGILVLVLGLIVFALIARYMRSIADTLLPETSEVIEAVDEEPVLESTGNWAWPLSLTVAAVITAALVRVGLAIRRGSAPFHDLAVSGDEIALVGVSQMVTSPIHGASPRARIVNAYGDFEVSVADAGVPREPAETAARHAGRARTALRLNGGDLNLLSGRHADARFGPYEPSLEEAIQAESASVRLREDMPG